MPLAERRTLRFAGVVALSLAAAYGFGFDLPFFAPLFAVMVAAKPAPPPGLKALLALVVTVVVTTGVGLFLIPMLRNYALSAVLIIASGLYLSNVLTVKRGQALIGMLLAMGLTLIPALGLVDYSVAATAASALARGLAIAVICQWIVYPFFPEDTVTIKDPAPVAFAGQSGWVVLRATLMVLPPLLLTFSNPTSYMPTILKTVALGQQGSMLDARQAGRELLGSTLLAGLFAILFWFALKMWPTLWMFFLWMLLAGIYVGAKLCGAIATRHAPSYWINVAVTMLILVGPAVEDSAAGKDAFQASAVRFSLFLAVTLYAWAAIATLEHLRSRNLWFRPQDEGTGTG